MQLSQNQKENIQDKFNEIDLRWSEVQQAIRIQKQQRNQDVHLLRQHLQQKINMSEMIEKNKNKTIKQNLVFLTNVGQKCKQNLKDLIQKEQSFKLNNLKEKNQFISNIGYSNEVFNQSICNKFTQKIAQIKNNLNNNDASAHEKTLEVAKQIKDQKISTFNEFMNKEKQRLSQSLLKIKTDAGRQIDQMRGVLKQYSRKKQESDLKIHLMIQQLTLQLQKMQQNEWKEGQITYQCLLKVLEDSCSKIRESQYK